MFGRLFLLIAAVALCFPTQGVAKRYVEGNTFVSTRSPKVKITLDDSFIYQGETSEHFGARADSTAVVNTTERVVTYFFVDASDETIERFVTIEIARLPTNWFYRPFNIDPDNYYDTGKTKLGRYEFQYIVYRRRYSEGCFANRFASKCGLKFSDYYLLKDHTAILSKNKRMYFTYAERLPPFSDGNTVRMFTQEDINKLLKNFEESIDIQ